MTTIVDFSDLKLILDLEKSSFSDYPDLELLADSVHASLENYCGRTLNPILKTTESGITIGQETHIDLENLPVTAITSVKINTIDITDYTVSNYGIQVSTFEGVWEVILKGGFKTIPADIYRAELFQIVYEYQNKNNLAVKTFSNDGGTTTMPGFVILNDVMRLLNPYRHIKKAGF